ncbi:hypothetical protein COV20_00055 [Candidatus Woesearchaeota archaeon CG10_big_fil_rev_8_21_14_0_10_45_16]|nr:MAG: hypothetical protein COV20_00055 [Candidatus Woesearchaeota archaeon CG10_big_fil_rev_8_21_14_0_10_45_16]
MVDFTLVQSLFIALALGALVGLEREYARYRQRGQEYAGIRTYPLIALLGVLSAYLGDLISIWVFVAASLIVGALIIMAYFMVTEHNRAHTGATSEIAGFVIFFVGALVYYGEATLATIVAVVMTTLLYARSALHNFAKKMKREEMADTLKFAIIVFVILPFLPNQSYGPYGIFNPYLVWLMVIFISGISFIGYILMKSFGEKGLELAAMMGGLVSSTAVTTSFAERSKRQKRIYKALALGVILANGIMFLRIIVVIFFINRELLFSMLIPLLVLAAATAVMSYVLWKRSKRTEGKLELGSPFTLWPALKFGVFFAIVLALVKVGDVYLSSKGVYIVSLLSGFADVDAITISLSQLAKDSLDFEIARNGIMIAALTNVAVKGGIAYWFGDKKFGKMVIGFFGLLILIGVALILLL